MREYKYFLNKQKFYFSMCLNVLTYLCNFCIYLGCQKPTLSPLHSLQIMISSCYLYFTSDVYDINHMYTELSILKIHPKKIVFFFSPFLVISGIILQWLRFVKTHHIYKKIKANFFSFLSNLSLFVCKTMI